MAGDTNGVRDVFVHDRETGATLRVSVATGGVQGNDGSEYVAAISADGRSIAFVSSASNLVWSDSNGYMDVFVHVVGAPPTLAGIEPAEGPTPGGTGVTLTGTDFVTGATVAFGGAPAAVVTVLDANTITATAPAHAAGPVDVVVTNPDTQPGRLAGGFTYMACTFTIDPSSTNPGAAGGAGGVAVTANRSDCSWAAVSNGAWIAVSPGSAVGTGSGTVNYSIAANPLHASRLGTMTVAGQTFTVTQAGVVCAFTIDPTAVSLGASGGAGSVALTTNATDCGWTAVSQVSWIQVTGGGSGTGNGTVQYQVPANLTPGARQGGVLIGGRSFSVSQANPSTVPGPPGGLIGSSTGSSLTLSWTAPSTGGLPTAFIIEAGSSPGLLNLANFSTGNSFTFFSANGVPNGLYFVRVRATNGFGTSGPSNEVQVRVGPPPPGAPTGLTAGAAGSTVTLSWNAPTGGAAPTAYIIEAGSAAGLADLATFSTGNTLTAFSAAGVANGTYHVRVRATNVVGPGEPSNEVILQVGPPPPGPPSGFSASAIGWTVSMSWNAPTTGGPPNSYTIEAGTGPGLSNLANLATNNVLTTFSTSGVADGAYYLRVRASNAYGSSAPSNEALLYVGCPGPPGTPANLHVTANSGGTLAFAWNAASGSPSSYIFHAGSTSGENDLASIDVGNTLSFNASGVPSGTYFIHVHGENACGVGGASNVATVIVP